MNFGDRSRINILVIDDQTYWRELVAETLRKVGFQVSTRETYDEIAHDTAEGTSWHLILLGCAHIQFKERLLIDHLVAIKQQVIVLATMLTTQETRRLFQQGVMDATNKTYHPAELFALVNQSLAQNTKRDLTWGLLEKGTDYEKTGMYSRSR
jgi:DNA-binding response OmpR family regulator